MTADTNSESHLNVLVDLGMQAELVCAQMLLALARAIREATAHRG